MSQDASSRRTDTHTASAKTSTSEKPPEGRTVTRQAQRFIVPLDILTFIGLVILTPIAWFLPQYLWPRIGRGVVALTLRLLPQTAAARTAHIDQCKGKASLRLTSGEILSRTLSREFEDTLLFLKCYRPDGWEPAVEIYGVEHLQTAAARGKGIVLWNSHFHHASLITKVAMYRAGFPVNHLSHPRHGFSSSRFGVRYLNPVRTHIENHYLVERVSMGLDSAKAAVEVLRRRLLAGGVVSITARDIARRPIRVPFLAGILPLAIGAPSLAQQTGATLLLTYTVLLDSGVYAVIIEPCVELDASQPPWVSGELAAREYARRLEPIVCEYPDQWLGWNHMETVVPSGGDQH